MQLLCIRISPKIFTESPDFVISLRFGYIDSCVVHNVVNDIVDCVRNLFSFYASQLRMLCGDLEYGQLTAAN